ncbi:hypothetical protein BO94DRAFT_358235 [Aspergillus sclerotioniger CBS 115572]|uniref:Rhodopsin domain-containing protein n=1 Tax=Aspergillus sclerotioniger CBS 115572 TaxID=1450535 RepID=A0A317X2Z5_9EURO|nr:hypothetical protein BO94DRAFT_358235 [Aspergillus sclerotioniger CBS 115572]PWY93004.1 hypothetical protein BO94DRAFT_358235 [Aspergillus sclerotioniger CBS 115572]
MTSALSSLLSLDPAELAQVPAGTPPPGQESNFIDPPSEGYLFLVVGSLVLGIMYITVSMSLYVKLKVRKRWAPDDWSRLISTIGATFYFITGVFAVVTARFGTHMWNLSVAHILSDSFIIISYFSNWETAIVWPVVKTTFFLLYLDMFRTIRWQRYAIYLGLFVNWGFYLAVLIASLYYISPAPGQSWQASFVSTRYNHSLYISIPIAVGSLVLDLYILLLPMAPIWNLQLKMSKKLGVMAVFATGLIACVASSLSIYFKTVLNSHETDFSYYSLKVFIMAIVEMCVGITASSMPSMALFFRHHGPLLSRFFSRFSHTSQHSYRKRSANRDGDPLDNHTSDRWPLKDFTSPGKGQYNRVEEVGGDGGGDNVSEGGASQSHSHAGLRIPEDRV